MKMMTVAAVAAVVAAVAAVVAAVVSTTTTTTTSTPTPTPNTGTVTVTTHGAHHRGGRAPFGRRVLPRPIDPATADRERTEFRWRHLDYRSPHHHYHWWLMLFVSSAEM